MFFVNVIGNAHDYLRFFRVPSDQGHGRQIRFADRVKAGFECVLRGGGVIDQPALDVVPDRLAQAENEAVSDLACDLFGKGVDEISRKNQYPIFTAFLGNIP